MYKKLKQNLPIDKINDKKHLNNSLVKYFKIILVSIVIFFTNIFADFGELTLNIKYLSKIKGKIFLVVLKNENGYGGNEPELKDIVYQSVLEVSDKEIEFTIKQFPAGKYVAQFFQDLNGNGKMDFNIFGIPKEPYGFSNGEKGRFGLPDYEDVEFEVVAGQTNFNHFEL